jgi:hypothetical protein
MRRIWVTALLLPALALGQQRTGVWDRAFAYAMDSADVVSGKSVFQVSRPDIIVSVTKHPVGADMFEISAVIPKYPEALMRQQILKMCEILGVPPRGLIVQTVRVGGESKITSTRATFATNGIIDREHGTLRIAPIVKGFAGAPEPYTLHGMTIMFNGEQPSPNVLRSYSTPDIRLQAIANENPPVVEYRIQLLSQDPHELDLPDSNAVEQKATPTASTVQQNGVDWSLWIPLLAAAVAASVLVYFILLRSAAKPRR